MPKLPPPDEYKEVITQFGRLTDIRFKLLALLPLGTVATVFVSQTSGPVTDPAIAAFAFIATICIATYNKRNDQHYDELIARAGQIERELKIFHGAFAQRPTTWLRYGRIRIEHRWPIGLLYASTAALWAYLFVNGLSRKLGSTLSTILAVSASALVFVIWKTLRRMEKTRDAYVKHAVREVIEALCEPAATPPSIAGLIAAHETAFSCSESKALSRLTYHWDSYIQQASFERKCLILAAVIDLPARWIQDICPDTSQQAGSVASRRG